MATRAEIPQREAGFRGNIKRELLAVRRIVPQFQRQRVSSTNRNQNRQQVIIQQRFDQRKQEQVNERPEINNFFEDKSEVEAFGDEGLTFFDSQKTRGGGKRTGSLFGI